MSIEINGETKFVPTVDGLADAQHSHALGETIIGDIDGTVGAYRELLSGAGVCGESLDRCVAGFKTRITGMSHAVNAAEKKYGKDGSTTVAHKRLVGRELHGIVSATLANSSNDNSSIIEGES